MQSKPITVIFLSKNSKWPNDLDPDLWSLAEEAWFDWKGVCGSYLPGLVLIMGQVAVGGVSSHLSKDTKSKRKVLNHLRELGFEPEIDVENSPY